MYKTKSTKKAKVLKVLSMRKKYEKNKMLHYVICRHKNISANELFT